jgi:CopG family nickel-responsive transcriptional regulator
MQRVTITIDSALLDRLDQFMADNNYANRSEAIRDMVRDTLEGAKLEASEPGDTCVATLSYIYDPEERELARRLSEHVQQNHRMITATTRTPLQTELCHEVIQMRGEVFEVQNLATLIIAERGIQHGSVNLVPVELDLMPDHHHHHGDEGAEHEHEHKHSHEHKHVHAHEHEHTHDHWHTHSDGTYHSHPHTHRHSHPHEHVHTHEHSHTHSHELNKNGARPHSHRHGPDHMNDFRAHDHEHNSEQHGTHDHDHPGHEAELHDDHQH